MRITKYNNVIKLDIMTFYSKGYSLSNISDLIGVSRNTLRTWINKHNLQPLLDEARMERAKYLIESGLDKLAQGATDSEETDKFIYYRKATRKVVDDEGNTIEEEYQQPVERTLKKKVKAPDSKAIEILSRKYAKEFDNTSEERELTTKILEGFTMRQLQEARKHNPIDKGASIEAQFSELTDSSKDS